MVPKPDKFICNNMHHVRGRDTSLGIFKFVPISFLIWKLPPPRARRIKSICDDSCILLASSSKVSVCWVPRLCNMAPHSLTKQSLAFKFLGSFDVGNSPLTFVSIIQGEACLPVQFVFSLNKISSSSKKKKKKGNIQEHKQCTCLR